MTSRALALSAAALLFSGCGLFFNNEAHIDGGLDAGALADTGTGRRDAGMQCVRVEDCPAPLDACDRAECREGVCSVTTTDCDDGVACTIDTCLPTGSAERCEHQLGGCAVAPGSCFDRVCDPVRDCVDVPIDDACPADDYDCTVEYCAADGGCVQEFDDSVCRGTDSASRCDPEGGDPFDPVTGCTLVECDGNEDCVPDGPCVGLGTCEDNNCVFAPTDGAPCTLANLCATGECNNRICEEVSRLGCNGPCEGGSCDPLTGACNVHDADGTPCDDSVACTAGTCSGGACTSGPTCEELAQEQCRVGSCVGSACTNSPSFCRDGQRCVNALCECVPDRLDCDGDPGNGCECDTSFGNLCRSDGTCGPPRPDGGPPGDAGVDAGPPVCDAGYTAVEGHCGGPPGGFWFEDCDNDGCCDCNRDVSFCNASDDCVPNLGCGAPGAPQCTTGEFCCPCTGQCTANVGSCSGCFPPGFVPAPEL